MNIISSPSPNYDERDGYKPEAIVIHCTDGYWPGDFNYLRDISSQVSSHFVIAPSGLVYQLVDAAKRAWHAGRVEHPSVPLKRDGLGAIINPNFYTIGIEVSLKPPTPMTALQSSSLRDLVTELCQKYNIPQDRAHIWGHREIYSVKTCPGTINVDALVKSLAPVSVPTPVENRESIKQDIIKLLSKL